MPFIQMKENRWGCDGIGRHSGLKIHWPLGRVSSSLIFPINLN